jgi:echinoid protein
MQRTRSVGVPGAARARGAEETQVDTHEGSTVILQCRFAPPRENATFFWLTHTNNMHDNAAIEQTALAPYYRVFMRPEEGRYDLEIRNVSYERDNGKYECRVKVSGTGENLYHKNITLTVLRAPGPPSISPAAAIAKEDQRLELQCNTSGGSPEPEVRWYRGNSPNVVHTGRNYVLIPSKEDDRSILKCVVRNRAMKAGETLTASVTLNVHYFPRVSVGTENPLRVEVNSMATLKCNVDSKPAVGTVRWLKDNSFVATSFHHVIPKVTLLDAGKYTCQADNGLSKKGESFLYLDVLYPPSVSIEGDRIRTAEVEDSITVHCNVSSNPVPTKIEWFREGKSCLSSFNAARLILLDKEKEKEKEKGKEKENSPLARSRAVHAFFPSRQFL